MQKKSKPDIPQPPRKPQDVSEISLTEISSYRLSRHNQLIRRGRDAEAERLGVSIDEWRLLFVLEEAGPNPSIRLAERSLMDRGTVSRSIRRMEDRGLVYRLADAHDARVAIVNLTDKGRDVAKQISRFMLDREMALIALLSEEEWETWLEITDKFHAYLKDTYNGDA